MINEKLMRGEAVFQAVFADLKGGLQRLKWMHEYQKKAGLAVTFSLPIRKPRCLIQGSVGPGEVPDNLSLQVQVSGRCLLALMHHAQLHSVALAPRYC